MALNRGELRDETRNNIKRTAAGYADSKINTRINWSQEKIGSDHTFEEMKTEDASAQSTTADLKNYAFPTNMKDCLAIRLIDGGDSRKLIYVPWRRFHEVIPYPEHFSTGLPTWYVDKGTTFDMYKIPDATYEYYRIYSKYPADLVDDSTESDLIRKDPLIIARATVFCLLELRELEDASYWLNQVYAPLLAEAMKSDHSAEDWSPSARPFTPGSERSKGDYWKNPLGSG